MFKWAVAEKLVPETVYRGLLVVEGLKADRSKARETERVTPVPNEHVEAVLPHLHTPVRAIVQIQRLTGMRPVEVAIMRACDIDTTADVWVYRPAHHKTAWRGKERAILIGPQCKEVLRPFLTTDSVDYLFRPPDARKERYTTMRAARKASVQPSQLCRRKIVTKREVPGYFDRRAYAGVVARACRKTGVPHWHPNKLRHSKATEVRAVYGLEGVQIVSGHTRADVTEVYAEQNMALAAKVAAETG